MIGVQTSCFSNTPESKSTIRRIFVVISSATDCTTPQIWSLCRYVQNDSKPMSPWSMSALLFPLKRDISPRCLLCSVGWDRYKSEFPSPTLMFEAVRRWPTIIRIMYFGTNKSMCATLYGSSSRPIQSWSGLVGNILTVCLKSIREPTTFSKSKITGSNVLCCLLCRSSSLSFSWSTSILKHLKGSYGQCMSPLCRLSC